ncbi:MAG: helix-turn-helix transcriptional regulator [Acetatifactor sp.]
MDEIDYIGYSAVHPKDFVYDVPNGLPGYLLLLISSPAEFLLEDKIVRVPANSAILYTPGYRIYYRSAGEEYRNDWIRFRSDHSFVEQFPLRNVPFSVTDPEYCHQLFRLLTWESSFSSTDSEANITHLLRVLFSKLRESTLNDSANVHTHELIALHKKIYNNPQLPWNVNRMAEELHLSASHVQTLYRRQFGSSCMDDVIEGRLRRAQDLLKCTEYSVRDIAEKCGYNNVEHFCRQFRQHYSCSPSQYRKIALREKTETPPSHYTLGGREFTGSKP